VPRDLWMHFLDPSHCKACSLKATGFLHHNRHGARCINTCKHHCHTVAWHAAQPYICCSSAAVADVADKCLSPISVHSVGSRLG
jgi:hypothetical protein